MSDSSDEHRASDATERAAAAMPLLEEAPLPGRRTRRRRSGRRRLLTALGPFLFLGMLAVLSTGVVKVVERTVPTRAAAIDAERMERAARRDRERVLAIQASLDASWVPSLATSEHEWLDDPLLELEAAPIGSVRIVPLPGEEPESETVGHSTIEISSTSNTSAAPPGMPGPAPRSP